jgi:hypothetical protein
MLFAILFTIGAVLITTLLYLALNPKTLELGGEGADLRYIGFALLLIILSAATLGSMLVLGKLNL